MDERSEQSTPEVRRLRFDWSDTETDQWHHTLPEFGSGANAISLLMPHAEPYVIAMQRKGLAESDLDEAAKGATEALIAQEAAHFKAHRDFNEAISNNSWVARRLDAFGAWIFRLLAKRSSAFGIAFAAAFEIFAFCSARWAEAGLRTYFGGADERSATLFLWHLAEEIEHKGVAHDVMDAHPMAKSRYRAAFVVAFAVLIGFTCIGGVSLFLRTRHALNPIRWFRLVSWGVSFAFVVLPVASSSLSQDFHPDQLVDPPWMAMWLREFDPVSQTLPLWTEAGLVPRTPSRDGEPESRDGDPDTSPQVTAA